MSNAAHFPCDGRNHHAAQKAQKDLSKSYKNELATVYGSPIAKVVRDAGGTQLKADNIIHCCNGTNNPASVKHKGNGLGGSFDWINTTGDSFNAYFPEAQKVYHKGRDSGNSAMEPLLKDAIVHGWSNISDQQLTEIVRRHVIGPYTNENCDILVQDEKNHRLYLARQKDILLFQHIKSGGLVTLRKGTRGSKMSQRIVGLRTDGTAFDLHLRARYHLNNGYGAWLKDRGPRANKTSQLCFKLQQDNVKWFVSQPGVISS